MTLCIYRNFPTNQGGFNQCNQSHQLGDCQIMQARKYIIICFFFLMFTELKKGYMLFAIYQPRILLEYLCFLLALTTLLYIKVQAFVYDVQHNDCRSTLNTSYQCRKQEHNFVARQQQTSAHFLLDINGIYHYQKETHTLRCIAFSGMH